MRTLASGYAALDAQLPGGGWPLGGMSEMLLPAALHPEWSLVAKALAQVLSQQPQQHAVLVAPPFQMFAPFAEISGVAARQLCCVHSGHTEQEHGARKRGQMGDARSVWVSEQALRCGDVCAVLAWLPHAQSQALRRLQLLAAQQRQLLWVFRPEQARAQSSPAPLRLWLRVLDRSVQVHVIKRRGPSLTTPVELPLLHERLLAELAAQARRKERSHADATAMLRALRATGSQEVPHALDGMAFAARR
ncbi:translesion DNA synthesis-associated protein ImuA [Diaphorobacter aerolatus]|uniref:Translesion DNA synthesis-associated protein ImuA n=1 Tax=Diaphorobacter aerolatus TaxID=1288495 RepID=A0A7H0GKR7_9BURK|nr:translesion DNA synthesis-associated protein ImuA [Diaphorobacter aerolatus]QNP48883.1 translesion DNA synthesis-associated protein ImuA [Diaphorobacter aerolatus]